MSIVAWYILDGALYSNSDIDTSALEISALDISALFTGSESQLIRDVRQCGAPGQRFNPWWSGALRLGDFRNKDRIVGSRI